MGPRLPPDWRERLKDFKCPFCNRPMQKERCKNEGCRHVVSGYCIECMQKWIYTTECAGEGFV